ncbi:hypothetical protein CLV47_11015 [Antricoccus suffuscus]|uniref:Uncharacterized protein n=1 Tax=Antricoccus suffuscus TaxID=1629062 RepID=A0A2T0ZY68_9ACTN|nr:hypothetical protein [Antricoccus suffuscus]PRZ41290.1 hypothetical protein CLV47_11015 [Antricoccus suffuscus]
MQHENGSAPLDPAAALRLIDQQTTAVSTRANNTQALIYAVWGLAYLIGFGALALDPSATTVYSWRIIVFGCAMVAGIAASFGLGARFGAGVRGPTRRAGIMIGLTWLLVFVASGFISQAIFQIDMAPAKAFMIVAGISVLLVGALYTAFGGMGNDIPFFLLGVWFLVVDAIAMLVGTPTYLTIMALLGGGGFFVGAVITKFTRSATPIHSGR